MHPVAVTCLTPSVGDKSWVSAGLHKPQHVLVLVSASCSCIVFTPHAAALPFHDWDCATKSGPGAGGRELRTHPLPLVTKRQMQKAKPPLWGLNPRDDTSWGYPGPMHRLGCIRYQTRVQQALQAGREASAGQEACAQQYLNWQQPADKSTSVGCFKDNKSGACEAGTLPRWRGLGEQGPRWPESRGALRLAELETD